MAEAPARARPDTTARMVAKATADRKPRKMSPPTALARCMTGMLPPPISLPPTTPPSKKAGLVPTMVIAAAPRTMVTRKNRPMKPVA
jgi:hypothetical protein